MSTLTGAVLKGERITVLIDPELAQWLRELANAKRRTLSAQTALLLEEARKARETGAQS